VQRETLLKVGYVHVHCRQAGLTVVGTFKHGAVGFQPPFETVKDGELLKALPGQHQLVAVLGCARGHGLKRGLALCVLVQHRLLL